MALFPKFLLLLLKPLLYLFNGCLLALYLPLVEACQVLPPLLFIKVENEPGPPVVSISFLDRKSVV